MTQLRKAGALVGASPPENPGQGSACRALYIVLSLVLAMAILAIIAIILAEIAADHGTELHILVVAILTGLCLLVAVVLGRTAVGVLAIAKAQLPVEQLSEEKARAVTANAVKTRYLANVSHEIRSPLNAIYGYAQLVERNDRVSAREAARVIRRSAEHLTSLVDGLLDISQIENGVLRVKTDVVQFRDFLDQVFWMMRPSAEAKGLEFRAEFPDFLPEYVHMDQSRLRQVLINLISNAIKFTESGSVVFKVGYSGPITVFEIIDTGPGIAPEDRERIFSPFERGISATQQSTPGVGLGLSITKAIVQIMGGDIELESEPGRGSCFRVSLLLSHVAGRSIEVQPSRRIIGYEGPRRTILVVDDDVQQLSLMRNLLESLSFEVSAVPNGETALELSMRHSFDLAVLDISLPGISGWDTAVQIRERLQQDFPIIMLSANAHEFHRPETERMVHDLFLTKPFEFNTLLEGMGALLKLTWKRDGQDAEVDATARRGGSSNLPAEAMQRVEKIKALIRIGHVRGIEAEIDGLAAVAPEADELVQDLYDCLDCFDLSAMAKRLKDV